MRPIKEALNLIAECAKHFGVEEISIEDALGRVLAEDIYADRDYPPFNRSTMDGYAVLSADFKEEKTELNLIATVHAGETTAQKVTSGTCIKIMTGAPVPEGADAVVRFEDTVEKDAIVEFTIKNVLPKQNIAQLGEDSKKNDLLIEKNIKLDATAIAVLAVTGKDKLKVHRLPRVVIVSTGNEIMPVGNDTLPHQVRDSNAYALKNFLKQYNITAGTYHVKDDRHKLQETLSNLLDHDILLLSGGVSKGEADYVPEVLISLGVREIFHRVRIKPGNPLWFGAMPNGCVVFGLPGNPVSVQVGYKVFIEFFLRKCFGMNGIQPLQFPLFDSKAKKTKFTEYFPCKLISKNNTTGLTTNRMNTSGDVMATFGSDGIAVHPELSEVLSENTIVEFYFWEY